MTGTDYRDSDTMWVERERMRLDRFYRVIWWALGALATAWVFVTFH